MSIRKMRFVKTSCDLDHLDSMLLKAIETKLLCPETAVNIVSDDEDAQAPLSEDTTYGEYVNTLKNIAHSVGIEVGIKKEASQNYTKEEIEAFIKEISEKLELSSSLNDTLMTSDDQKALDIIGDVGYESIHSCRYIKFGFGRLPKDSYKKLTYTENRKFDMCVVHQNKQYYWVIWVASDTYYGNVRDLFESLFFEEIHIPDLDIRKVADECKDKLQDVYAYCIQNDNLQRLHKYCVVVDDEESNTQRYEIAGYVPLNDLEAYKNAFKDLPVKVEVEDPKDKKGLKVPTALKNNRFFKPFEMFVEMYSLPSYFDFDPTIFLGITYCIMFGIMFADVGQGLVLFLVGTYLYDIKKKPNNLFGIIGRIGIFAMIFGFFFGSVFGNEELLTPVHQQLFGTEGNLIHVMEADWSTRLLIYAVSLGVVLILMCMLINMYKTFKHKDLGKFLFSTNGIAGFVFYAYVGVNIFNMFADAFGIAPLSINLLSMPFIIVFVVIPFVCFFFEEPLGELLKGESITPKEGWGGFILQHIFEIITVILEFVSNTMSFLRIGGFILSHAGMMLVVMTLCDMVGGAGSMIVFVFGNIFVMCLEGLIVGIQTLRLEYYELFSRYYDGGGRKYEVLTSLK